MTIKITSLLCCLFLATSFFSQKLSQQELNKRLLAKITASENYKDKKGNSLPQQKSALAVSVSLPEQDCNSAISVCQNVYNTTASYIGGGNQDEIPSNTCLEQNEKNSVWYTFTSNTAGSLAFQIFPNDITNDYDFALYDITNANCTDITNGSITPIRCNYSSDPGATGLSASGTSSVESAAGSNQSTLYTTATGKTYVLIISNFSDTDQSGYSLDFSTGTASIFDNVAPTIDNVIAPCGSNVLTFQASEQVMCNSIASNGSDFTVSGVGGPYTVTASSGINCGSNVSQISFTIFPALSGVGPWVVGVQTGSDGNSLLDACGNAMAAQTKTFIASPPIATITGPTSICKNNLVALTAPSGATSYTWTGASVPVGQQNQQTISFNANTQGTFNFNVSVTFGTCGTVVSPTHVLTVKNGPVANFVALPSFTACVGTSITFSNTTVLPCTVFGSGVSICNCGTSFCGQTSLGGIADSHIWSYGDGATDSYGFFGGVALNGTHTYTAPGIYNVSLKSATSAGLGSCPNTVNKTMVILPSTPILTVSPSVTICPGTSTQLEVSGGLTYTWSPTADLSSANTNTTIASPTVTTVYTVTAFGCVAPRSATVEVVVANVPPVIGSIVGQSTVCANLNSVNYSVINFSGTSYLWSLPNGITLTPSSSYTNSSISVNYTNTAGTITVSATNACGTTIETITVTIQTLPVNAVASPTLLCLGNSSTITATGGTIYSWLPNTNLSSTTGSVVVANPSTSTNYTVVGKRGVCTGTTVVSITVLPLTPLGTTTICPGQSTVLSASGFNTYTWSPSSTLSSANGGTVSATPLATTQYTVRATSPSGCVATNTVKVTHYVRPTITVNAPVICANGSATLLANGAASYTWNSGSSSNPLIVSPTATTIYSVTGTSTLGCTATQTTIVTVTGPPAIGSVVGQSTVCTNVSNVNYSVINVAGTSYTWFLPSGVTLNSPSTGTAFSVAVNYTNTAGTITVSATNACGTTTAAITVTIVTLPVTALANPTLLCLGNTSTITATGGTTYSWSPNTNLSSTTGSVVLANPNTSISYTVIGRSGACTGTTVVTVNVIPLLTTGTATICPDQSTVLSASGYNTYTWSPATTLSSANGGTVTATPLSTTQYTVMATNASGCVGSNVVTVTLYTKPTITINAPVICANTSATLSANGAVTYTWNSGSSLNPLTVSPVSTSVYSVTGTSINGCTATQTTTVTVNNPQASFTGFNNSIETLETVLSLQNTSTGAGNIIWLTCYQGGITTQTISLPLLDTGICCVKLYAIENTCTDSVEKCVTVIPKTFIEVPNVFTPNGDNKNDVFTLNASNIGDIELTIYDRWGLKLFNTKATGNIKWDGKTASGSLVNDGTYFYVLKATGLDGKAYDLKGTVNVFK